MVGTMSNNSYTSLLATFVATSISSLPFFYLEDNNQDDFHRDIKARLVHADITLGWVQCSMAIHRISLAEQNILVFSRTIDNTLAQIMLSTLIGIERDASLQ